MSKASTSTSIQIFRNHLCRRQDGSVDASGVISTACYSNWLEAKGALPSDDEAKKFHRTLTNHDGRVPFDPEEEAAILLLFRQRKSWPCLPDHFSEIGKRYRSRGYHEKRLALQREEQTLQSVVTMIPDKKPFMSFSLTSFVVKDVVMDELESVLRALSTSDAEYLRNLGESVVRNFSYSPVYVREDWNAIQDIFRYMALSRSQLRPAMLRNDNRNSPKAFAELLCKTYSVDEEVMVMVIDQTGSTHDERFLAENQKSIELFGGIVSSPTYRLPQVSALFSTVLCLGAAVHQPGRTFGVTQSCSLASDNNKLTWLDVNYVVDPATHLLVVHAKVVSSKNRV
ncbi:hypothetical protein BASA81_000626 [Batrachochytrium salamandrivorans]|nr:hypothetical protein BASA81_000626 [Batrachochytrium salamandrivorans]